MEANEYSLPIGLCRQAVMKMDSFLTDVCEIIDHETLSPEDRLMFEQIKDSGSDIITAIVNTVSKECGEEEFLGERIEMDKIDEYPVAEAEDIMDTEVD